jgi:hypothetical protein
MSTFRLPSTAFACLLLAAAGAVAAPRPASASALPLAPGSLVAVSVTVDDEPARLYPAPDGSGRSYLEARQGSRYAVTLQNRSGERLGAVLTVDGLNVISGARDTGQGRMYVLDPWQGTTVQGWRTSLEEVRRFRFVDERTSYAARSGKANGKMGWIELAVYRECRPEPQRGRADADAAGRNSAPAARPAPAEARSEAFPGTGWGERTRDEVALVTFDPESAPSERVTLRYEYRPALVALGVIPPPRRSPDRLQQREHAEPDFAQPPLW